MRHALLISSAVCLMIAAGCEKASQSEVLRPSPGKKVELPINWVSNPPAIQHVDLAEEKFKTHELRATVERWEEVAEEFYSAQSQAIEHHEPGLAAIEWHQEPWYFKTAGFRGAYRLIVRWWSNAPQHVLPDGYTRYEMQSSQEFSGCSILFGVSNERPAAERVHLRAVQLPPEGWGAEFSCSSNGSGLEQLNIIFIHRGPDSKLNSTHFFLPNMAEWRHHPDRVEAPDVSEITIPRGTRVGDRLNFDLHVALPFASGHARAEAAMLCYKELLAMRQSPEAFKQESMQLLDELAVQVEADFATGVVVKKAYYLTLVGRGCQGPEPSILAVEQTMTEVELQACLEIARSHILAKRKWIDQNYVGLHGALVNVFPIEELIVGGTTRTK